MDLFIYFFQENRRTNIGFSIYFVVLGITIVQSIKKRVGGKVLNVDSTILKTFYDDFSFLVKILTKKRNKSLKTCQNRIRKRSLKLSANGP